MKKITNMLVLATLLVLASCQALSDVETTVASTVGAEGKRREVPYVDRSKEEVKEMALEVATLLAPVTELRNVKNLTVSSVYTLESRSDLRSLPSSNVDLHVVEFSNNEGYALVSENSQGPEVLYVSDQGKFEKEFYRDNLEPYILAYIAPPNFTRCRVCRGIGTCPPNDCIYNVSEFECEYGCRTRRECTHQPELEGNWIVKLLKAKNNLLKTNWHLGSPFNLLAPFVSWKTHGVEHEGRAYIGCNTVAIMQMMAYHQYPKVLGGYEMPWHRFREVDDFEGDDRTLIATVSKYVADEIGSMYGIDNTRETAAYPSETKKFMIRSGYKEYIDKPYSIDAVMDELNQNRPLFINAYKSTGYGGHIWILDGYKVMEYTKYSTKGTSREVYSFVHCNWGWGRPEKLGYCLDKVLYVSRIEHQDVDENRPNDMYVSSEEYSRGCTISIGVEPKENSTMRFDNN